MVRSFSVHTTYTPHRLVGFPGMVLDKELPTIIGKIVTINSTLDANGVGTSTIEFQAPRAYKEYDFSNNANPWTDGTFDENVDEWPGTPFWMDNTFNADIIGETLKPLVNPESTDKVTIDFHGGDFTFDESNISKSNINIVAKSISNLKKKYNIYQEKHPFIEKETRRSLMEESAFWSFLLGNGKTAPNYFADDDYKSYKTDLSYEPRSRQLTYTTQPFVKERRDKVIEAK